MKNKIKISLFLFSSLGLVFASYTSGVKLFTSTCAFNETCPYFLGYPACYYGFALFLFLTLFSYFLLFGYFRDEIVAKSIYITSAIGILFAGYFTLKEIPLFLEKGFKAYVLGLPTCALGLIFFIAIFVSVLNIKKMVK